MLNILSSVWQSQNSQKHLLLPHLTLVLEILISPGRVMADVHNHHILIPSPLLFPLQLLPFKLKEVVILSASHHAFSSEGCPSALLFLLLWFWVLVLTVSSLLSR